MNFPEYLVLFSNEGPINVKVKFKESDTFIPNREMNAAEISQLISQDKQGFLTQMTFDECCFDIEKYEINPVKKLLTIFARLPS